jgi:hypothetical protein
MEREIEKGKHKDKKKGVLYDKNMGPSSYHGFFPFITQSHILKTQMPH